MLSVSCCVRVGVLPHRESVAPEENAAVRAELEAFTEEALAFTEEAFESFARKISAVRDGGTCGDH